MTTSTVLSQIDWGSIVRSGFQRGYVRNRDAERRGEVTSYGRMCPEIMNDTSHYLACWCNGK